MSTQNTTQVDWDEAKDLADCLTGVDNPEEDYGVTEIALTDKYGVDMDTFHAIVNDVFEKIDFGISPISQTPYVGAVAPCPVSKGSMWVFKKEVTQQFFHARIEWATEGEDLEPGTGFSREITCNGVVEYEIIIKKPKQP